MTNEEKEFYANPFKFSYSSLNKLLFCPSLFYKDYILKQKQERLDKHLIEGKVLHCLLFEPENLNKKFKVIPGKLPTDNVRKIMQKLANSLLMQHESNEIDLMDKELEEPILRILKEENLYQSLNEDSARLSKIQSKENLEYWKFINNPKVDVLDQETLTKCQEQVELIKSNEEIKSLIGEAQTDFPLDSIETFKEKYLECDLKHVNFGLKGYVDFYKIDDSTKTVTILDLKTTSKTIDDFPESVNYYNYGLQAAIYNKLVYENLPKEKQNYKVIFIFVVIDKYNQIYPFEVDYFTLNGTWTDNLNNIIKNVASYHYDNNNYTLPYKYLISKVKL